MTDLVNDIRDISEHCFEISQQTEGEPLHSIITALYDAIGQVGQSASGSWIGYHANVYYEGFRPPPPGDTFSPEWGLIEALSNPASRNWKELAFEEVNDEIIRLAGNPNTVYLNSKAKEAGDEFDRSHERFMSCLEVLLEERPSKALKDLRKDATSLAKGVSEEAIIGDIRPQGKFKTRDAAAISQGTLTPHHIRFYAAVTFKLSPFAMLKELGKIARRTALYLDKKRPTDRRTQIKGQMIFIGHGRSPLWRELKDFISGRLHLEWDEFDREIPAGKSIKEHLLEMLNRATFAFLVMTAEDEHADKTLHARENVIHEAGLFQGRLGFEKAIILREENCAQFSNYNGLIDLRFPKGDISARFEQVRKVLEREKILQAP